MALKDHYPDAYAQWAGNPKGNRPDYTRCCEGVYSNHSRRTHQCRRKNGHGPQGAYCKQHDPEVVKRREDAREYAYRKAAHEQLTRRLYGADEVLRAIAEGDSDPRAAAQAWLDEMGDQLTPPKDIDR